ncbi:hypothetical protein [Streptomyces sp. RTd22]|uniref:hypothetical protein n=1 Tax=Streptomyces sp. RTd22 TaxID=1841249 RepID=UPI0007C57AEC|nr:hypothetical protein [Streptomyces sp. RTd22]
MDIEWGTLGGVFGVSLGITIVVVVMFSLGIAARARAAGEPRPARALPRRGRERWAMVVSAVCFAACLAVAGYGIDLIIPG